MKNKKIIWGVVTSVVALGLGGVLSNTSAVEVDTNEEKNEETNTNDKIKNKYKSKISFTNNDHEENSKTTFANEYIFEGNKPTINEGNLQHLGDVPTFEGYEVDRIHYVLNSQELTRKIQFKKIDKNVVEEKGDIFVSLNNVREDVGDFTRDKEQNQTTKFNFGESVDLSTIGIQRDKNESLPNFIKRLYENGYEVVSFKEVKKNLEVNQVRSISFEKILIGDIEYTPWTIKTESNLMNYLNSDLSINSSNDGLMSNLNLKDGFKLINIYPNEFKNQGFIDINLIKDKFESIKNYENVYIKNNLDGTKEELSRDSNGDSFTDLITIEGWRYNLNDITYNYDENLEKITRTINLHPTTEKEDNLVQVNFDGIFKGHFGDIKSITTKKWDDTIVNYLDTFEAIEENLRLDNETLEDYINRMKEKNFIISSIGSDGKIFLKSVEVKNSEPTIETTPWEIFPLNIDYIKSIKLVDGKIDINSIEVLKDLNVKEILNNNLNNGNTITIVLDKKINSGVGVDQGEEAPLPTESQNSNFDWGLNNSSTQNETPTDNNTSSTSETSSVRGPIQTNNFNKMFLGVLFTTLGGLSILGKIKRNKKAK